jgi:uncharacterized protein (DUF952 family)
MRVYKILPRDEWESARAAGVFRGASVDIADGYIHLSTAAQAPETARRHFAGQADLVLLELETDDFGDAIRWEPSRGGELFPHLYGTLDPTRVGVVRDAPLDGSGVPQLGSLR